MSVADRSAEQALDLLDSALDALQGADMGSMDEARAARVVRRLEAFQRRGHAQALRVQEQIERDGLHRRDGHASAKVMVRHLANLSGQDASRRALEVKALRDLPHVRAKFEAGRIGLGHLDLIARTRSNPRIREQLAALDEDLAVAASRLPYEEFRLLLRNWAALADEDGAADRSERNHANRDAWVHQDYDDSWSLRGNLGSLDGQHLHDIFHAFIRAEWEADWAEACTRLGDDATTADLARTDAQRRADALLAMSRQAADGMHAETGHRVETHLVMDHITFERNLARLFGRDPGPDPRLARWFRDGVPPNGDDPEGSPAHPDLGDLLVGYRCDTLAGNPIDPTEAMFATLLGHVRRRVIGADHVQLDMGRTARLFTGPRQLALRLAQHTCYWPGCQVPVTDCQGDHLEPWNAGGRTDPGNGAPACGRHNRIRNHGYTVHRDTAGTLHVHHPDGHEIT